jgi:hypothetical protein
MNLCKRWFYNKQTGIVEYHKLNARVYASGWAPSAASFEGSAWAKIRRLNISKLILVLF